MKFACKPLLLLLAGFALCSCGGGGGDGHGAFTPPSSGSITLSATTTQLPLNVNNTPWFPTSPFSAEVDINWRNGDGTPVSGQDLSCSISPVEVASIHILDDASTDDDESQVDWGNIQVHSDTGHALCWVFARGRAGNATLTVGGIDPITGASLSSSLTFTVQNASGPLPASVTMAADPSGVYVPGSGGTQNSVLSIAVLDGGNQPVPDPIVGNGGADNVLLEIIGDAGGARLSANSVAGPVSGASVETHTVHGVATASFQAGTVQGPVQIRATVDRSDNNVSNGIADPLSTTTSVVVSDGKLYSLEITKPTIAPNLPTITLNTVSDQVTAGEGGIPPDPDATLSLAISALGTDRQGNPVIPGTPIRFGAVDEPVGAPGDANDNQFLLSGIDGNPQEGGTLFTAPTGHFTTGGGGAGPGDALIVFGKAVPGNSDLESAVTVQTVNSATSLNISSDFNRNDTTGVSVDYGSVLPYLIGRAQHGNITTQGTTNDVGVVHASLTYTVNSVGNSVAIWAEGDGVDRITGEPRDVVDAGTLVYPGLAPASLFVSPLTIPGNTTQTVTVCVNDALGIALRGVLVGYSFDLTAGGSGTVDGASNGQFADLTGTNGCASGSVTTTGVPSSETAGTAGTLNLTAAGATGAVTIQSPVAPPPVDTATLTLNVVNNDGLAAEGTYAVNVSVSGDSGGFSPPTGQPTTCQFNTPPDTARTCTITFEVGTVVGLLAQGTAGPPAAPFSDWGTCGTTSPSTSVTMSSDMTCTATFDTP
ncbi:MAG TPA: hypothetical protein VFG55_07570 [Rhodanobacteraceae bacterium]|nr:hypothetical protein [Rhodanobacteraceae bacterium]